MSSPRGKYYSCSETIDFRTVYFLSNWIKCVIDLNKVWQICMILISLHSVNRSIGTEYHIQFVHILIRIIVNRHLIYSLKLAGILHLLFRLLCFFFSLVFCSCLLAFCAVLSLPICGILPRKDGNLDTIPNLFTQCYCHRIDCNPLILIPFSTSKTDECRWCLNSQSTTERVRERDRKKINNNKKILQLLYSIANWTYKFYFVDTQVDDKKTRKRSTKWEKWRLRVKLGKRWRDWKRKMNGKIENRKIANKE